MYSDTDTVCLEPIENWGANATLWRDGNGWLNPSFDGESVEQMKDRLGQPSVIIGIEADVGDREDWALVR